MQATTRNQGPLTTSKVHTSERQMRKPGMPVAFSQGEKQALGLDSVAMPQQPFKPLWTQGGHALHQRIDLINPTGIRRLVTQFQHGSLRCRTHQHPALRCFTPLQALVQQDRKSTRLNSSHVSTSYAVLCLTHTSP